MADTVPRWTEYLDLDEVQEALRNPKLHAEEDIEESIKRWGYIEQGVMDERTGRLVGGHGRLAGLRAMRDRGDPPPNGIVVAEGRWRLPVQRGWRSADDDDAFAAGLALNRIGEKGGWALDPLTAMLEELSLTGGLTGTGYTADDLDDLIAQLGTGQLPPQETDASYATCPERGEPAQPRSAQGLHEVGLMFQGDQHRQFTAHLAALRARWGIDAAPLIVLKALEVAVGADA